MNNMILQLLSKALSGQGQQQSNSQQHSSSSQVQNPSASSYPPEAFQNSQGTESQQQNNPLSSLLNGLGGDNNMLSLLSSILSKGDNPLSSIMGSNKKEEPRPSPKDEILL